jgi:hypothetical protein
MLSLEAGLLTYASSIGIPSQNQLDSSGYDSDLGIYSGGTATDFHRSSLLSAFGLNAHL